MNVTHIRIDIPDMTWFIKMGFGAGIGLVVMDATRSFIHGIDKGFCRAITGGSRKGATMPSEYPKFKHRVKYETDGLRRFEDE